MIIDKSNLPKELTDKYSVKDNAFKLDKVINPELDSYKSEPKDEVKITLGDENTLEFIPNVELKRWNEVSFKVKPKLGVIADKDKVLSYKDDKIKFDTPKISFEMFDYTEGEGGYKYIWYLNEKPATNKVEFDFESSGLNFYRQPPLTEEYQNGYSEEFKKEIVVTETQVKDLEGNVLVERPENVVGSYVFYHKTKGGMVDSWGKDYKTGQGGIIYKPKLIDANGLEGWGKLNITWINPEKTIGIYSVEIPQEFLDKAVYPIKSNDYFGYTTEGSSKTGIRHYIRTNIYSSGGVGTMTFITANVFNWGGSSPIKYALYKESDNSLVDYTDQWLTTAGYDNEKQLSVILNASITNQNYHIAWWVGGTASDLTEFYYNSGLDNYYDAETFGNWPNTFADTGIWGSYKFSIYATYTPAGGGETESDVAATKSNLSYLGVG